jgi:hypothetical protein
MSKHRLLTAALAGCLVLGVAGCSALRPDDGMETVSVDVADSGAETAALAALGITDPAAADLGPVAGASASPGAKPGGGAQRHKIRVRLRKHMLHGEVVVQTKSGPQTIVAQRGTVTAKGNGTITVRSADGFTLTWSTDAQTRFVVHGAKAGLDQVDVGAPVGLGGIKGDPQGARLVVVPKQK